MDHTASTQSAAQPAPVVAPIVAIVGATGAAGSTVLRVLGERGFAHRELRLLASAASSGKVIDVDGVAQNVEEVSEGTLRGVDLAFFAAGSAVSKRFAQVVARGGGIAIDKSSAYRMDPAVPLIVPEVNGHLLNGDGGGVQRIIANPNCVAIPLSIVLAPLQAAFGLARVIVSTYQAASGGGRGLLAELDGQVVAAANGAALHHEIYPHVLHGNVVPGGWAVEGDDTEEEVKVVAETRRVLNLPLLPISVTTVRVPVRIGHSAAVWIDFGAAVDVAEAREILQSAAGISVIDDSANQDYPTPLAAAGGDQVLVGRVRRDHSNPGGICLFFAADNLRKGAATNAVQVAELALSQTPLS